MSEIDTLKTDLLTCPHCGYEYLEEHTIPTNLFGDENIETETNCWRCKKRYHVTVDAGEEYAFTIRKIEAVDD